MCECRQSNTIFSSSLWEKTPGRNHSGFLGQRLNGRYIFWLQELHTSRPCWTLVFYVASGLARWGKTIMNMGNRTRDEVMRCHFGSKAAAHARRLITRPRALAKAWEWRRKQLWLNWGMTILCWDTASFGLPVACILWLPAGEMPPRDPKIHSRPGLSSSGRGDDKKGSGQSCEPGKATQPQTRATLTCEKRSDSKLLSG